MGIDAIALLVLLSVLLVFWVALEALDSVRTLTDYAWVVAAVVGVGGFLLGMIGAGSLVVGLLVGGPAYALALAVAAPVLWVADRLRHWLRRWLRQLFRS